MSGMAGARTTPADIGTSSVQLAMTDERQRSMTKRSGAHQVLAFEINTNFTRYALFTDGRMGIPGTFATPNTDLDEFYDALAQVVRKLDVRLDGIAISMPGFINPRTQTAETAGALHILARQRIGAELTARLGMDIPTWMENDANCAAMAEKMTGNARKCDDFVLLTLDMGMGGALFLGGKLRRGKDWRAGELGMMIINYDSAGALPLHDFVSTMNLSQWYAEEFGVSAGDILPSTLFHKLDDPRVRAIVERWLRYVAVGIFNTVAAVDPQIVLIGGSISREPALVPMLEDALNAIRDWKPFKTQIKRCRHSGNAGLIGAYYMFVEEVVEGGGVGDALAVAAR